MGSQTISKLPIVDFTKRILKPGTDSWLSACKVVRAALEDHGCFVARYDKITPKLCNSIVARMEELFRLPLETKKQKTSEKLFHCYYGQIPFLPLYESFGLDDPVSVHGCQNFTRIMWPQGNDAFCESIHEYSKLLAELDHVAKRMVFESYVVDMKLCQTFIESSNYLLRCLHYRAQLKDESDLGMQPHTDLTMQSILHQVSNIDGLQVKLKNGEWIVVDSSPNLFVVMAGDGYKVWSNGRIRPCEHRVIMNGKDRTRYSMGLFSFSGETVKTPQELIDEQHPLLYKPFNNFEYLQFFDKNKNKSLDSNSRIKAYCGV